MEIECSSSFMLERSQHVALSDSSSYKYTKEGSLLTVKKCSLLANIYNLFAGIFLIDHGRVIIDMDPNSPSNINAKLDHYGVLIKLPGEPSSHSTAVEYNPLSPIFSFLTKPPTLNRIQDIHGVFVRLPDGDILLVSSLTLNAKYAYMVNSDGSEGFLLVTSDMPIQCSTGLKDEFISKAVNCRNECFPIAFLKELFERLYIYSSQIANSLLFFFAIRGIYILRGIVLLLLTTGLITVLGSLSSLLVLLVRNCFRRLVLSNLISGSLVPLLSYAGEFISHFGPVLVYRGSMYAVMALFFNDPIIPHVLIHPGASVPIYALGVIADSLFAGLVMSLSLRLMGINKDNHIGTILTWIVICLRIYRVFAYGVDEIYMFSFLTLACSLKVYLAVNQKVNSYFSDE